MFAGNQSFLVYFLPAVVFPSTSILDIILLNSVWLSEGTSPGGFNLEKYLCTSKMLRKTFVHKTKTAFEGRSDIAKRFTRHKDEKILEGLYDGATREEVHQNSAELGKVLNFVKRRA